MIRFLFYDSLEPSVNKLFFEIWAMSQRSEEVARYTAQMYQKLSSWLEGIMAEISPEMPEEIRKERAAMIVFFLEGLMVRMKMSIDDAPAVDDAERFKAIERLAYWP